MFQFLLHGLYFVFHCFMLYCTGLVYYFWNNRITSTSIVHDTTVNTETNTHSSSSNVQNTDTPMAPRRRVGSRQNDSDSTTTSVEDTIETAILSIQKEMRLAKRRWDGAIRDIQLEVVCFKSDLEPDMLSSNLYELMMNENRALFVDEMDGYLDFCSSKTRHVTFQNGCQITSLEEDRDQTLVDASETLRNTTLPDDNDDGKSSPSKDEHLDPDHDAEADENVTGEDIPVDENLGRVAESETVNEKDPVCNSNELKVSQNGVKGNMNHDWEENSFEDDGGGHDLVTHGGTGGSFNQQCTLKVNKKVENTKNFVKRNIKNVTCSSLQTNKIVKTPVLSKTNQARNIIQQSNAFERKSPAYSTTKCNSKTNWPNNCDIKNSVPSSSKVNNLLRVSKLDSRVKNFGNRLSVCQIQNKLTSGVLKNENATGSSKTVSTPNKACLANHRSRSEQRANSESRIPKSIFLSPVTKSKVPVLKSCTNTIESIVTARRSLSSPKNGTNFLKSKNPMMNLNSNHTSMKHSKEKSISKGENVAKKNVHLERSELETKVAQVQHNIKPPTTKEFETTNKCVRPTDKIVNDDYKNKVENHSTHNYSGAKTLKDHDVTDSMHSTKEIIKEVSLYYGLDVELATLGSGEAVSKSKSIPLDQLTTVSSTEEGILPKTIENISENLISNCKSLNSFCNEISAVLQDTRKSTQGRESRLTDPEDLYIFRNDIPIKKNRINFIRRNKERLKRISSKNRRRGSKDKPLKGIKMFKDSIVIDSRYLEIINRLLEDHRKCLNCKREHGMYRLDKGPSVVNKGSGYDSQVSAAGSSLVSSLKTSGQWQERNRNEKCKDYSALVSLSDRSSMNNDTIMDHVKGKSENHGKAHQKNRSGFEKEFSGSRNRAIDFHDESCKMRNISGNTKVIRTFGTNLSAKSVELVQGNTTQNDLGEKSSRRTDTACCSKKSNQDQIHRILLNIDGDNDKIYRETEVNILPSKNVKNANYVKIDQIDICDGSETADSLKSGLSADRQTPGIHENSSDIIKSHNTISKLHVSSLEKIEPEVYNLDSTQESTYTRNDSSKSKNKNNNSHGSFSKKYNTRQPKRDGSIQIIQRSAEKEGATKCQNNSTKKANSKARNKNISASNNTSQSENIGLGNRVQNLLDKLDAQIKSLETNSELLNKAPSCLEPEMDDVSLIAISDKLSHNGNGEMTGPSLEIIDVGREFEDKDVKAESHGKLQKIKTEPNSINVLEQDYDSSVEYLESKLKTMRASSDERPISLVPIDNLLSTRYKTKANQKSYQKYPMDSSHTADCDGSVDLKKHDGRSLPVVEVSQDFEISLDNAFTSTKHDMSGYTPEFRTPIPLRPRDCSILNVKSSVVSNTPKCYSNSRKPAKTRQSNSKTIPDRTPTSSARKSNLPDALSLSKPQFRQRTPKLTPKYSNRSKPQFAASTPLDSRNPLGIQVKEEPL